jgi:hypothetical protein
VTPLEYHGDINLYEKSQTVVPTSLQNYFSFGISRMAGIRHSAGTASPVNLWAKEADTPYV